jgi:hypothetical protein
MPWLAPGGGAAQHPLGGSFGKTAAFFSQASMAAHIPDALRATPMRAVLG